MHSSAFPIRLVAGSHIHTIHTVNRETVANGRFLDGMDGGASNQANRKSGRVHDSEPTTANSDPFIRIQANQN